MPRAKTGAQAPASRYPPAHAKAPSLGVRASTGSGLRMGLLRNRQRYRQDRGRRLPRHRWQRWWKRLRGLRLLRRELVHAVCARSARRPDPMREDLRVWDGLRAVRSQLDGVRRQRGAQVLRRWPEHGRGRRDLRRRRRSALRQRRVRNRVRGRGGPAVERRVRVLGRRSRSAGRLQRSGERAVGRRALERGAVGRERHHRDQRRAGRAAGSGRRSSSRSRSRRQPAADRACRRASSTAAPSRTTTRRRERACRRTRTASRRRSPIVVYQFNVFANAYSNDASLLLPTNALGQALPRHRLGRRPPDPDRFPGDRHDHRPILRHRRRASSPTPR